jgi:hypothetical protein
LLEIQSGGRKRSPELVAEDGRLMNDPQKKITEKKLASLPWPPKGPRPHSR